MLRDCNNDLKIVNVSLLFLKSKRKTRGCPYLNSMKDIVFLTLLKLTFVSNFVGQQAFTFDSGCNQHLNPTALLRKKQNKKVSVNSATFSDKITTQKK